MDSDLRVVSGTSLGFTTEWRQQNEAGEWQAVNITGCTARFAMRDTATGAVLLTATTGDGITIANGSDGVIDVNIPPQKTHGLAPAVIGDVDYELRVYFPSGDVYSLIMGYVAIVAGVIND